MNNNRFFTYVIFISLKFFILQPYYSHASNQGPLLSDSIPSPYYIQHKVSSGQRNFVQLLHHGLASLEKRLEIIRNAKKQIEVEYFIWNRDLSSRVFTLELINAAKRGVQIRILVDKSVAVFKLNSFFAEKLHEHGIRVKYYNTAPLVQISTIQFRNHRKLITVDDLYAITGGRNIGDDYFDVSGEFNFLDTDIYIQGPIVEGMRRSFDEFFNSSLSDDPQFISSLKQIEGPHGLEDDPVEKHYAHNHRRKAQAFFQEDEALKSLTQKISQVAAPILSRAPTYLCPELTFVTDRPGATFWKRLVERYSDNYRYVRKTLYDKISNATKSVTLVSPYMINNKYSRDMMYSLLERKTKINLYTNSLASTDAIYVAANLYMTVQNWAQMGMSIKLHSGEYIEQEGVLFHEVRKAKWGLHTKAHIYEYEETSELMVGTYNIDNRSNHYNAEMAVFCKGSDPLVQDFKSDLAKRTYKAYRVSQEGTAYDFYGNPKNLLGADPKDNLLMGIISLPSWLLKFLL